MRCKLAAQGAIVVTFNYRLGLFGWVAQPALDAEGHLFGNYGLLDQQQVLEWVRRNIGAFGGDPTRVTLGGQSAGSQDTEANVVSPLARSLFHRAIFQSIVEEPTSLADAEAAGNAFAVAAGCGSGSAPSVASLSSESERGSDTGVVGHRQRTRIVHHRSDRGRPRPAR